MFEFLFKYPRTVFAKGTFVLLAQWPLWLLILAIFAAAGRTRLGNLEPAKRHCSFHARNSDRGGLDAGNGDWFAS